MSPIGLALVSTRDLDLASPVNSACLHETAGCLRFSAAKISVFSTRITVSRLEISSLVTGMKIIPFIQFSTSDNIAFLAF